MDRTTGYETDRRAATCPGLSGARQRPPRPRGRQFGPSRAGRGAGALPFHAEETQPVFDEPADRARLPEWAQVPRDEGDTEPS
jgi:hypothetical protein